MNVSVPLANDGYFFARADTVGVTDADAALAASRCISEERQRQIETIVDEALMHLARCETAGRC